MQRSFAAILAAIAFWAEDFNQIHIFVTYDENGLIDTYRIEYGDTQIYEELPGTVEYQF